MFSGNRLLPEESSRHLPPHCISSPRRFTPSPRVDHSVPSSPVSATSSSSPCLVESSTTTPPSTQPASEDKEKNTPVKPKIWSLADVATSTSSSSPPRPQSDGPPVVHSIHPHPAAHPGFPAIYGALRPWGFPASSGHPLTHPGYLMSIAAAKGLPPSALPPHPYSMMSHTLPGYRVDALALSRAAAAAAGMANYHSYDGSPEKTSSLIGSPQQTGKNLSGQAL